MSRHDCIKLNCQVTASVATGHEEIERLDREWLNDRINRRLSLMLGEAALRKAELSVDDSLFNGAQVTSAMVYIFSREEIQAYRQSIIIETLEQLSDFAAANKPAPEENNDD